MRHELYFFVFSFERVLFFNFWDAFSPLVQLTPSQAFLLNPTRGTIESNFNEVSSVCTSLETSEYKAKPVFLDFWKHCCVLSEQDKKLKYHSPCYPCLLLDMLLLKVGKFLIKCKIAFVFCTYCLPSFSLSFFHFND